VGYTQRKNAPKVEIDFLDWLLVVNENQNFAPPLKNLKSDLLVEILNQLIKFNNKSCRIYYFISLETIISTETEF